MNEYSISDMKVSGDLISFKIEGAYGFWVWVHKPVAEVEAAIKETRDE